MTYIGFDYHKKWTQAAAIDEQGNIIELKQNGLLADTRLLTLLSINPEVTSRY